MLKHVSLGAGACLLTVRTGTDSGKPARNMAMRDSLARCDEGPRTLPTTMSPIACAHPANMSDSAHLKRHLSDSSHFLCFRRV